MRRLAADDPTHSGIMAQTFGVVHILVASEATKDGLPKHSDESMSPVLAAARVSERLACHHAEVKRVVKFTVGEQPGIGGQDRTAKLQHQAAVKIEPESLSTRFTRRIRHGRLDRKHPTC